jgi:hypothetical protein
MPRLPFENLLPDTKCSKKRGYKFSPSADVAGGTVVYAAVRQYARYWMEAIPCDLPGRAYQFAKVVRPGEEGGCYECLLADRAEHDLCDCRGFTSAGHCKHLDILRDLDAAGELPELVETDADAELCDPDADTGSTECDDWACEIEAQYEDMHGNLIAFR